MLRRMQKWIESYLEAQKRAVDTLQPAQLAGLVATLKQAHDADAQIFVVGVLRNGPWEVLSLVRPEDISAINHI